MKSQGRERMNRKRSREGATYVGEVVSESEGCESLSSVFGQSSVGILFDRMNRNGIRDGFDQSRVLRCDEDTEAVPQKCQYTLYSERGRERD